MMAMPFRAGTLAETRTQVDLRCDHCGHQLSIEMTPPVLIVTPDRQTDDAGSAGSEPPIVTEANHTNDRRNVRGPNMQRMRVGLRGVLMSADEAHTVTVLYSLDGHCARGRMRLLAPGNGFPSWLVAETRLKLHGYDGQPLEISVTVVKPPRPDHKDDDHFAEFVVSHVTR
jgi:hypothetical protein